MISKKDTYMDLSKEKERVFGLDDQTYLSKVRCLNPSCGHLGDDHLPFGGGERPGNWCRRMACSCRSLRLEKTANELRIEELESQLAAALKKKEN